MVVSAILTTALAPITGALFGASYGTSIRIGYEIIFPALFGDVINEQKNNPSKLQEEGTKRTIESMHKMFRGVGGAAAMEFGIEQGIEMAKKKTESQDVQDMIDLNLGLTSRQLNKRGKSVQFQDPLKDAPDVSLKVKKFKLGGDFLGLSHTQILAVFNQAPHSELLILESLFLKEGHDAIINLKVKKLVKALLISKKPPEIQSVTPEDVKSLTPKSFQVQATLLANIAMFRQWSVAKHNKKFGTKIINDTNGRKHAFNLGKSLLKDAIKKYQNWLTLQKNKS